MFTYSAETNWVISWEEEGESEDEQYVRFRVGSGLFAQIFGQFCRQKFREINSWILILVEIVVVDSVTSSLHSERIQILHEIEFHE